MKGREKWVEVPLRIGTSVRLGDCEFGVLLAVTRGSLCGQKNNEWFAIIQHEANKTIVIRELKKLKTEGYESFVAPDA